MVGAMEGCPFARYCILNEFGLRRGTLDMVLSSRLMRFVTLDMAPSQNHIKR